MSRLVMIVHLSLHCDEMLFFGVYKLLVKHKLIFEHIQMLNLCSVKFFCDPTKISVLLNFSFPLNGTCAGRLCAYPAQVKYVRFWP